MRIPLEYLYDEQYMMFDIGRRIKRKKGWLRMRTKSLMVLALLSLGLFTSDLFSQCCAQKKAAANDSDGKIEGNASQDTVSKKAPVCELSKSDQKCCAFSKDAEKADDASKCGSKCAVKCECPKCPEGCKEDCACRIADKKKGACGSCKSAEKDK